jgi:Arc/MetJ-type ribon-helix-helix transcriptional regulator
MSEEKNKSNMLTVRLGDEEKRMVDELKNGPHWMNISEYVRATIRHIYESKTNKAGRAK